MRLLCFVIIILVSAVDHIGHQLPMGHAITTQLIGHDLPRLTLKAQQ